MINKRIKKLTKENLEEILDVERKAFIPLIQATEEVVRRRLNKEHVYLGVESGKKLIGTLALRFTNFVPDFTIFCIKNPTFSKYAEKDNESNANAIFVYSIGIVPQYRDGVNARNLLQEAFNIAKQKGMEFLIGDARVPSYNGSCQNIPYEQFGKNEKVYKAVDRYFK